MKPTLFLLLINLFLASCNNQIPAPPEPVGPLPSPQQIAWHEMESYAFIHFSMNTFTDKEWGFGDEKPEWFNPSELDCRQWARIIKAAGMKGIILTTKHHDGFCLWPSEGTEHSVKNSPWREGKGNLLRELRDACDEYGLKLGFYLSPWDRNHADYGKPEYLDYYRNQLKDILTNYGEIFEVWFDGANGGDGYYGGVNENRIIDKKTYYDWENTQKLVLELQPNAIIFSDKGPGTRWIGNEQGYAGKTNWCLLNQDSITIGGAGDKRKMLNEGDENGTHWIPGETDVSIRPGWFYHESQDNEVKSLGTLLDIYFASVGRNSNLLLNIPIDKRGLIHENDSAALMNLKAMLDRTFANNLAKNAKTEASNFRGNHKKYYPSNTLDNDKNSYWATDDGVIQSSLTIDFGKPEKFNLFLVQEYIPLGQRVKSFQIEVYIKDRWEVISEGTTIGYKRILRFPMVESQRLRLNILDAKACPVISNIEVYEAPEQI
ncbi:MAG: alpha-L-fucosidase [Bacteroidales bacterium]|nr:alpha-L-fucosidase [Bacteroidales bacterium]MCF8457769.1 alpha-L-fucosidase [Bacteroidales bacterium]